MTNTIIEILIDNSGSMGYMAGSLKNENKYLIDGLTRMTMIKKVMSEQVIPTIDYANQIIIRTFGYNYKKVADKEVAELSIPVIYEGPFDKQTILTVIV